MHVLRSPSNGNANACADHGVQIRQVAPGGLPPPFLEGPTTSCSLLPAAIPKAGSGPGLSQLCGLTCRAGHYTKQYTRYGQLQLLVLFQ
jgi:hypothetical protein